MADLHPDIRALFDVLRETGLSEYVDDAESRIEKDAKGQLDIPGLAEAPFMFDADTRGPRQLEMAEASILAPLQRELKMVLALKESAPKLEISKIVILPDALPPADGEADGDELLSPERIAALEEFVEAWHAEARRLRRKWMTGYDSDDQA